MSAPPHFDDIRLAHGSLAAVSFVILMPLGAIVMRTGSFRGLVWLHAGWMYFAYTLALAAMGLGIWMATSIDYFDKYHVKIGLAVIGALLLQPVSGMVHHLRYKHTGRSSPATFGHVFWGRAAITLAIINGGFGLQLARPYQPGAKKGEIIYGVVAGVMWLAWMSTVVLSLFKSKKSKGVKEGETADRSPSDAEKLSANGNHL